MRSIAFFTLQRIRFWKANGKKSFLDGPRALRATIKKKIVIAVRTRMICGYRHCGLIIGMVGLQLLLSPFSVASRYVGGSKVFQVVLGSITSRCGPERVAEACSYTPC